MGADRRAQRHEEGQKRQAVGLVARVEITIERDIGEMFQPEAPEVHQQKGEIVERVDLRERIGEFDAVEGRRLALEEADVAQDQIAMAVARASPRVARVEESGVAFDAAQRGGRYGRRLRRSAPAARPAGSRRKAPAPRASTSPRPCRARSRRRRESARGRRPAARSPPRSAILRARASRAARRRESGASRRRRRRARPRRRARAARPLRASRGARRDRALAQGGRSAPPRADRRRGAFAASKNRDRGRRPRASA